MALLTLVMEFLELNLYSVHGVVMTTFYYCSVNDQSGLPKNSFSQFACITLIHHNVLQDLI